MSIMKAGQAYSISIGDWSSGEHGILHSSIAPRSADGWQAWNVYIVAQGDPATPTGYPPDRVFTRYIHLDMITDPRPFVCDAVLEICREQAKAEMLTEFTNRWEANWNTKTAEDVTIYGPGFQQPATVAINVKAHYVKYDAETLRDKYPELTGRAAEYLANMVFESAQEDFWSGRVDDEVGNILESVFGKVKTYSAGRSGGWLIVPELRMPIDEDRYICEYHELIEAIQTEERATRDPHKINELKQRVKEVLADEGCDFGTRSECAYCEDDSWNDAEIAAWSEFEYVVGLEVEYLQSMEYATDVIDNNNWIAAAMVETSDIGKRAKVAAISTYPDPDQDYS